MDNRAELLPSVREMPALTWTKRRASGGRPVLRRTLSRAACCLGITVLGACQDTLPTTRATGEPAPAYVAQHEDSCSAPIRVVLFQDKSGSAGLNRTPQLGVADLDPLIEYVGRCGGELALGLIEIRSNVSLVRMYVPVPPAPAREPEARGTPFQVAQARARYEVHRVQYEAAAAEHRTNAERQAEAFRAQASAVLALPHDARRSDVWGAISRSGYFLGEQGSWRREPRMIAVLVSDAIDNVAAPSVQLPEGTELFLVNGAPSLGALGRLNPVRFESFGAAVRYILHRN